MASQPSTAEQLRDARLRIAALERELQLLRASSRSPPSHTQSDHHASSPRRNQVAAYSDVSRDQSQLSVSCLDLDNRHTHLSTSPSSPSSPVSPLIETKLSSAVPSSNSSPALSDIVPINSKTSKRESSSNHLFPRLDSNLLTVQPTDETSVLDKQQSKLDLLNTQQSIASPTPSLDTTAVPTQVNTSCAVASPCTSSRTVNTNHIDLCNNKNKNNKSTSSGDISSDPSPVTSSSIHAATTLSHVPKRRPPSLSVVKTTTTKKDRSTLVAKCLEPRPGQTRYWTEEEHERFLEAIAEYGEKAYVAISNYVETRTPKQVRTHAQKFQMKMARLARQSLEAGQPIQMPPGMCPVIEVPVGSKSTIVPITPEQTAKLCAQSTQAGGSFDPSSLVSNLATTSRQSSKKRGLSLSKQHQSLEKASKHQPEQIEPPSSLKEEDQLENARQSGSEGEGDERISLVGEVEEAVEEQHNGRGRGRGRGRGKKCLKLGRNLSENRDNSKYAEQAGDSNGDELMNNLNVNHCEEEEEEQDVVMGEEEELLECAADGSGGGCEESCSSLTDACAEFIACADASVNGKTDMELETNNFVASLNQSLEQEEGDAKTARDFLISGESTNESTSREVVDGLEDLDNLEDGDLPLASFVNATENWLLSEASVVP